MGREGDEPPSSRTLAERIRGGKGGAVVSQIRSLSESTGGRISGQGRRWSMSDRSKRGAVASREPGEARGSRRREAYSLYVDRRGRPSNETWRRELPQH